MNALFSPFYIKILFLFSKGCNRYRLQIPTAFHANKALCIYFSFTHVLMKVTCTLINIYFTALTLVCFRYYRGTVSSSINFFHQCTKIGITMLIPFTFQLEVIKAEFMFNVSFYLI